MTTVKFLYDGKFISGFEITGHSTADSSDAEGMTVCAAVSSAAYLTANTLTEIVGADATTEIDDGKMYLRLNSKISESQNILKGLELHLSELSKTYKTRIRLLSEV